MHFTMPFGKYKGVPLNSIPRDYLHWVLSNCTNIKPYLRAEIIRVLGGRPQQEQPKPPAIDWRDIIGKWRRELAMRYHPDRGGDLRVMQALNDAADRLAKLLEEVAA